jgi:hypothetical protein
MAEGENLQWFVIRHFLNIRSRTYKVLSINALAPLLPPAMCVFTFLCYLQGIPACIYAN